MAHSTYPLLFCVLSFLTASTTALFDGDQNWLNHGGDICNRRYAEKETKISPTTVSTLALKWKFFAGNDITATPAIFDGTLYFPSWNGNLYAVNACNGSLVWRQNFQELTGLNSTQVFGKNYTFSRATPTIAEDLLLVAIYGPAFVIAVKRSTGKLVWSTQLDSHRTAVVTMSGTYYEGNFFVGTSSSEETLPTDQCCTFRGSLSKLDVKTGAILWQTFTLPDNHDQLGGYAGAAIWGSSPAIDIPRNLVYIATGNLYTAPLCVQECQRRLNNQTNPANPNECIEPENHSESILALDLDSGNITWYRQLGGYDVYTFFCTNVSLPNCPPGPNPDADFGEAPLMFSVYVNGSKQDLVAAGQKSGIVWALNRDDGSVVWFAEAGPGGILGGATWGSATDEKRVYTNIANSELKNFTLKPSTRNTTAGGWVAMDAGTGKILWSTENPSNATSSGPVSVANGVVFAGSTNTTGPIYAMDAETGKILWSYNTGATVYGGMSVSNGCIYLGNGYRVNYPAYTPGTSLYALCVA